MLISIFPNTMKNTAAKAAIAFLAFAAVSIQSVSAAAKVDVSALPAQVAKGGTSYVSVTVFDADGGMVSDAKPLAKANPSYAVSIGNFVNCASAEGHEICGKADQELVGLKGAYVAEVKAKETEGKVKIDAYVDGKAYPTELTVGKASVTSQAAAPAQAPAQEEGGIADVKAGGSVQGKAVGFSVLALLAVYGIVAYRTRRHS